MLLLSGIAFPVRAAAFVSLFLFVSGLAQGQQNARSVPGMFSTSHGGPDMRTRSNTQLPSANYHAQIDLSRASQTLEPVDLANVHLRAPNQIGLNRAALPLSQTHPQMFCNTDGSSLIVFVIRSQDAAGIGVHFRDFHLRGGEKVYVYGAAADSIVCGPFTNDGPWGNGEFWSGTVDGDTAVIEFFSPAGEKMEPFELPEISHIFDAQAWRQLSAAPDVLGCEIDASCYDDPEKNAVGRILFNDNGVYVCTGTLVADRAHDQIPYFLTANHCVSSQAIAQTVEVYWFYQTTSCNSGVLRNWVQSTGHATWLAGNAMYDFALLRLVDSPPAGTWFAAWTSAPPASGALVFGLHHPGGHTPPSVESFLRRALGTIISSNDVCSDSGLEDGYRVSWTLGTIEGGSSGSGLFNDNHKLIGALSCASDNDMCSYTSAIYSKLYDFYISVRPYLDPAYALSNDQCSGPIPLHNGVGRVDNTADATSTGDPTPVCVTVGNGVWYSFTPAASGTVAISTCGSDFDTVLQVYTGSCNSLAPVPDGCNVYSGPSCDGLQASVSFAATAGVTYRILAGGYAGDTGNLHIVAQLAGVPPLVSPYDFNLNGKPDYLLFNPSTRGTAIWYMNNNVHSGGAAYGPAIPLGWNIVDIADFNGDDKPDYLLFNPSTRRTGIWYLNNNVYMSAAYGPTLPAGWQLVATGDFNGDGRPDYALFNSSTRQTLIWYLNNNIYAIAAYGPTLPVGWAVIGLADFNHDGKPDYLLFNASTRQSAIWHLNNNGYISGVYGPALPSGWQLIRAADFNGDGKPDYVFYNPSSRQTAIWYMNNNRFVSSAYGPTLPAGYNLAAP